MVFCFQKSMTWIIKIGLDRRQFDQIMLDTLCYGHGHFTINFTLLSVWTPTSLVNNDDTSQR